MASIQARKNKNGEIISYSIRVYRGEEIKPYTMTYTPPETWSESRARKEAERQAVLFEKKCKDGFEADTKLTFSEYADYVLRLKERTGTKKTTLSGYYYLLQKINAGIGHLRMIDLRPQHLNNLYEQLSKDGLNQKTGGKLSSRTIIAHHKLVSTICEQAEKEMLILYNPARKATPPKLQQKEAKYFQIDDVNKILDSLKSEPITWQTLIQFLITSGCRRGEALGLKWDCINFESGQVLIKNNLLYTSEHGVYEDSTKTGQERLIKLPPDTMNLLRRYRGYSREMRLLLGQRWQFNSEWQGHDFVFTNDVGEPLHPDSITKWLSRFSERHNLPAISPHDFRHTYASILISQGVDIVTTSKTLGHERVSTTLDIYAGLMEEASSKAADCIEDVLFKAR